MHLEERRGLKSGRVFSRSIFTFNMLKWDDTMMTWGRLLKQVILLIHKLMSNISGLQHFSVFDLKKLKYLVTLTANQGCHTLSNSFTFSLLVFFLCITRTLSFPLHIWIKHLFDSTRGETITHLDILFKQPDKIIDATNVEAWSQIKKNNPQPRDNRSCCNMQPISLHHLFIHQFKAMLWHAKSRWFF